MNGRSNNQSAGTVAGVHARVRAGAPVAAQQASWLQSRAPGPSARQRQQWRERLWACLSLAVLVAGWDVCARLDDRVAVSVLEAASPRA